MNGMTIKQLADQIGVSKTAIRKYMTAEFRKNHVETAANGVITISENGCKLLSENFRKHENVAKTTANQFSENTENTENITIPRVVWETLQKDLEAKDLQIKELTAELAKEREHSRDTADKIAVLAKNAQELQGGAMQHQLEAPGKKDSWLSRIFGKNKE